MNINTKMEATSQGEKAPKKTESQLKHEAWKKLLIVLQHLFKAFETLSANQIAALLREHRQDLKRIRGINNMEDNGMANDLVYALKALEISGIIKHLGYKCYHITKMGKALEAYEPATISKLYKEFQENKKRK